MIAESEEVEMIDTEEELCQRFVEIQGRCLKLQNFQDAGMTIEEMIATLEGPVLRTVQKFAIFSPNQKFKEIHTEKMKFLALPYHIGWLYGRLQVPRFKNIQISKSYLTTFLELMQQFNSEDEECFPKSFLSIWKNQSKEPAYKPPRNELIVAMKESKAIQNRYKQSANIKEESQQRQAIKDFLSLQIHSSLTQLRSIEEEMLILAYKQSIEKDPEAKEQHQTQISKPVPKIKVMRIPPKQEILQHMIPPSPHPHEHHGHNHTHHVEKRKDLVAEVWQENANKPTMTLQEVGELQYQNMIQRQKRQKEQRQANKQDSDEEKEHVDDRIKKEQRAWDDWKDQHEKGAGNRNNR